MGVYTKAQLKSRIQTFIPDNTSEYVTPEFVRTILDDIVDSYDDVGSEISGAGTSGKFVKWTSASEIGDSLLSESGSVVTVTGTLKISSLTASRVVISDSSKNLVSSATTAAELGYVNGVTSSIQNQLNAKEPSITTLPVGKGGTGVGTAFSAGSIIFAGASGIYSQDNTNLFWDNINNFLSIGSAIVVGATSPNVCAILDLVSNTTGFLMPRMTQTQRDNIVSPGGGLQIYNVDTNLVNFYNGSAWKQSFYLWEEGSGVDSIQTTVGAIASGLNTIATGVDAEATYANALAYGNGAKAHNVAVISIGSADDTVFGNNGPVVTGIRGIGIGNGVIVSGSEGGAIGGDAESSGNNAWALGTEAIARKNNTINIAATIITRSGPVATLGNQASFSGAEVTLSTPEVDLKTTSDYTITIPTGTRFYPDSVDIILTTLGGTITGQPTIRAGITGTLAKLLAAVATSGLSALFSREVYNTLLSAAGESSLTAGITVAATGSSTIKGRFVFRGKLIENE